MKERRGQELEYTPNQVMLKNVADALHEEIVTRYKRNDRPVLLSDLGGLRLEKLKYRSFKEIVRNMPLRDFVWEFLDSDFVLMRHQDTAQKLGVVPRTEGARWSNWYILPPKKSPQSGSRKIFERQFWNAFATPYSLEKKRLIQIETPFTFMDVPRDIIIEGEYKEIQNDYLSAPPDDGRSPSYQEIQRNISRWLDAEKLDENTFLKKSEKPDEDLPGVPPSHLISQDAFLRALANLDSNDLHEVRVPLDVILKAIRKIRSH